jgi:hypothetical protein
MDMCVGKIINDIATRIITHLNTNFLKIIKVQLYSLIFLYVMKMFTKPYKHYHTIRHLGWIAIIL